MDEQPFCSKSQTLVPRTANAVHFIFTTIPIQKSRISVLLRKQDVKSWYFFWKVTEQSVIWIWTWLEIPHKYPAGSFVHFGKRCWSTVAAGTNFVAAYGLSVPRRMLVRLAGDTLRRRLLFRRRSVRKPPAGDSEWHIFFSRRIPFWKHSKSKAHLILSYPILDRNLCFGFE